MTTRDCRTGLMTAGAVAAKYGVSKQTVLNWHRQGMPAVRLEAWSRGFLVFDEKEVDAWVREHKPWQLDKERKRGSYWYSRFGQETERLRAQQRLERERKSLVSHARARARR